MNKTKCHTRTTNSDKTNKYLLLAPLSLLSITVLSGIILVSSTVSADNDSVVDEINITVPVSCTLSGTGMNSHNANIVNGTYQADIGSTTLKAFCNDTNGFAIYAIGYTDNEYGKTVLTNSTLGTSADIATGTATSGSISNWAMKLTAPTSPTPTYPLTLDNSFGNYHAVPAEYTKVAHRDSTTDIGTNAEGSTLTTTYAAFMSQTQPAGTYIGQVRYTLVHPANETPLQPVACEAGKICYNPSSGTVQGQMGKQTPTSSELADGITLWAPNFKRDGYGFAGWNDKFDYSGNYYGPNETITTPSDVSTNGLSLYAVWIKSEGSLQNWDGCSDLVQVPSNGNATILNVTALTDERDGNTYAVGRLADGKCWTIENLRLADKDANNNDINLSSANTHNPSLPLNNSWYYLNQQGTLTTSNHLSVPSDPTSTNPDTAWCTSISDVCAEQSMLATNNITLFVNNTSSNYSASSNVYSYGNYYNWYSATAGHGVKSKISGETTGDICPTGWHLPTGGDATKEFSLLDIALGGTGSSSTINTNPTGNTMSSLYRSYPNNFVNSGYLNGGSITRRNFESYYWSSVAGGNDGSAYDLRLANNQVIPARSNSFNRYIGKSVRCISGI